MGFSRGSYSTVVHGCLRSFATMTNMLLLNASLLVRNEFVRNAYVWGGYTLKSVGQFLHYREQ